MRAIWKGAISFGLVSITVRLYAATEDKSVRFHQVHRADGGRVRHRRVCSSCAEEVPMDDIAKGYDLGGGEMIVLTDDDLDGLPLAGSRIIEVVTFVPRAEVDPILYKRTYFLEPDPIALRPYALLRDALRNGDRVAVVKVALRGREQPAALRVRDGVLVLHTMLWPDELRTPDFGFLDTDVPVKPAELSMAESLIDSMSASFDPAELTDEYRVALREVLEARIEGRPAPSPAEPAATSGVDLMAALQASVDRARRARESDAA
ncbi:Ku protein [Actinoplanes sp. LDG1-06]|uniref:Non-homologous end joining protein Ku n=1 Tax=Paractinoplanes ovalisporus TaxID=2810368 RepID=A0ABS2AK10_9ACTN|nr:Ku protein [Actinoplanes ovalisporus]